MKYDPAIHHRRSIRLRKYDYTRAGAYFITICTQNRECLFGEIVDDVMQWNDAGMMVTTELHTLPIRFSTVQLDAFVVMPNHIHSIIVIGLVGAPLVGAHDGGTHDTECQNIKRATTRVAPTVGDVVGAFKSLTTVEFARGVKTSGWPVFPGKLWQRNYFEHIIRDEADLNRIRRYISENPARWPEDTENPMRYRGGSHNAETSNPAE